MGGLIVGGTTFCRLFVKFAHRLSSASSRRAFFFILRALLSAQGVNCMTERLACIQPVQARKIATFA